MYHYFEDKEFLHRARALSGELLQLLCHYLKEDYDIGSNFCLVGSGAKNIVLQNNNQPIDLDYNLEIVRCKDIKDCLYLNECVRKTFNKCLRKYGLNDCEDSTSSLTSKLIRLETGNTTAFSIDVCIIVRDNEDNYNRLIHKKTGRAILDKYFWNKAPQSKRLKERVNYIKKNGQWEKVREQYIKIKNQYLTQNDNNHPSFVCYIEAVNNVYNSRGHWK